MFVSDVADLERSATSEMSGVDLDRPQSHRLRPSRLKRREIRSRNRKLHLMSRWLESHLDTRWWKNPPTGTNSFQSSLPFRGGMTEIMKFHFMFVSDVADLSRSATSETTGVDLDRPQSHQLRLSRPRRRESRSESS